MKGEPLIKTTIVGFGYVHGRGKRRRIRTWLGLWLEMKGVTNERFAAMLMCRDFSVSRWLAGKSMTPHYGRLLRALWPDSPVYKWGGPIPLLNQPMPESARTYKFCRYLLMRMELIKDTATPVDLFPLEVERARRRLGLKPGESAESASQPDADGVGDVLPPPEGGKLLGQ